MSVADERQTDDPRFGAAFDLIRRTGATGIQIRYQDDEQPTVWLAVAIYGNDRFEVDAATGPLRPCCDSASGSSTAASARIAGARPGSTSTRSRRCR